MKNIVRKLSMAVLIISTLMLSGCGSNNTEKSTEKPTTDVEKENAETRNGMTYIKMSEEETKALIKGQSIKPTGEKSIAQPDRKILEKMGLDYEIVVRVREWDANGNSFITENEKAYVSGEGDFDFCHVKTDEMEFEYVLESINIIPIVEVYEENNDFYKVVVFSDGVKSTLKLSDKNNFDYLQSSLPGETSAVDSKNPSL